MKIYGLLVTRNEASRYLQSCLDWHIPLFDGLLVYDDGSTDGSKEMVVRSGAEWRERGGDIPTFMDHEGRFRQASLDALEATFSMDVGDWVMSVDADEFLVGAGRSRLQRVVTEADVRGYKSIRMARPELWSLEPALERVDGYWGSLYCNRLFRWEPGGVIADERLGCGSEPTYVKGALSCAAPQGMELLHVGYAEEPDRREKYQRYSLTPGIHNVSHIKSIVSTPKLKSWDGFLPEIYKGHSG